MVWLWYDMWMTDICICSHMIWKWHEICHGMRYVINWHVYDMIYCDAICIWWNVMLTAWNVMLCLLNCVYTAWYECHEITINGMRYNPVRIMYDMIWTKNFGEVIFNNVENEKILGPHAFCVLVHLGIPLFHHDGTTRTPRGRWSIIMFYIMLPWRLLILIGVRLNSSTVP